MDPLTAFLEILKNQGVLVAGLFALMYMGGKWWIKQQDIKATKEAEAETRRIAREDDLESRYKALIDSTLQTAKEQTISVVTALVNSTAVMQRIEVKLNEKSND